MRVLDHPVLGRQDKGDWVTIFYNGEPIGARVGEPVAAALYAAGIRVFRYTKRLNQPRGIYCGIGRCTDCMMVVNGVPNVRTCVTPVEDGMRVEEQNGLGYWGDSNG